MDFMAIIALALGIACGQLLTMFVMFKFIMSDAGAKFIKKYIAWAADLAKDLTELE
jgi:hypothetical protein